MEKNPFEKIKPHIQKDLPFGDVSKKEETNLEKLRRIRKENKLKGKKIVEERREGLQKLREQRAKEGQEVLRRVGRTKFLTEKDQVDENESIGEKEEIQDWKILVKKEGYTSKDQFDEAPDMELQFKAGKFIIDEKEVSVEEFWEALGKGKDRLHKERPDIEDKIKKDLYYNKLKIKTKGEIDVSENEEMQQALNKE